jgi:nitrogen regulatory protein PII-like uncharacterized protein
MNFNRTLSIVTMAGIAGLVVLNYKGANVLLHSVAGATTGYLKTVQGR